MTDIPAAAISVAGSGHGATSYIICAFVSGFLLATVIFWIVNRQLQKDWQAEYRRLMGGIGKACAELHNTLRGHGYDGITQACILNIKRDLNNLYDGDSI